jgi:hypothetical protein
VYLTLTNFAPYAEAAAILDIRLMDEPEARIDEMNYRSLLLDMGQRSADGWLARLSAAELGTEQDGLLNEARRALTVEGLSFAQNCMRRVEWRAS